MNRRILIIVILTAGCLSQVHTEEEARQIAADYIRNAPTYSFDGFPDALEATKVEPLECDGCFEVTVKFACKSQGFGDRSAYFLISKLSLHTAIVRVEKGKVTSVIIDGIWDEMAQKAIG
jgi:hypothetical protein